MHHRPDSEAETGQGGGSPRRSSRSRRLAKAALFGGFVALLTRSGVRGRVLDALFGPEEEFEYESATEPEPLTDLSADPADAQGDPEDHDEDHDSEPDSPAEDEPREDPGASWERAPAQDADESVALPEHPDDPPPSAFVPEPGPASGEAPEPSLAPRIFALPSMPSTDTPIEEADAPPSDAQAGRPDPPASYVRTPPAPDLPDPAVSDAPATDAEPGSAQPPSASPAAPADGDDQDGDGRYSWGGDAAVEVPAPAAGERAPGDESPAAGGGASVTPVSPSTLTDRPLPRVDEPTNLHPWPAASPSPTHETPAFPGDVERGAPAPSPDPVEPAFRSPHSRVEPLAQRGPDASEDDASAGAEPWTIAAPFVIGEDPPGRDPDAEPWRTAPSIVIENGDLIEDAEPAAAVSTPWNSSDTNGGRTPRPWASPDASEPQGEHRSSSSMVAVEDESTPPAAASSPAESPVHDAPSGRFNVAAASVEPAVTTEPADAAPESSPAAVFLAPVLPADDPAQESAVASPASEHGTGESAQSPVATTPAESPVAATAPAVAPTATASSAESSVAAAEPAIGEASPRRSGWWLSRRRRGPGPEPPRWD